MRVEYVNAYVLDVQLVRRLRKVFPSGYDVSTHLTKLFLGPLLTNLAVTLRAEVRNVRD